MARYSFFKIENLRLAEHFWTTQLLVEKQKASYLCKTTSKEFAYLHKSKKFC
jgi:hypothetical protein